MIQLSHRDLAGWWAIFLCSNCD